MDFHSMKRKDLQALCKKHGIPANLKNIEMANKLASLFEKETEDETKSLTEESTDCEIISSKEAKKVRFSPEIEVFEFSLSVKKSRPKNVRVRSQRCAQDLQQGGVEIRRSTRIMAKGITIAGRSENESNPRRTSCSDVTDFQDQKKGKYQMKDVQDGPDVEKVSRRSRFLNDIYVQTNTQERRRSIRLKASDGRSILMIGDDANSFMGGGTSDGRPLCSTKESKGERKTKQSERSVVVNYQDGESVKYKAKEPSIDCKVPRRSKRLGNKLNVLMDKRPVKNVKSNDVDVEKAPKQSTELEKSVSERLVDGQAQKGGKQSQRSSSNDCKDKKLLQGLKRTTLGNMVGQAMSNSLKKCSVISCERDGASVDKSKKTKKNDEMQLRVRFTRNSSRHDSFKAPPVIEGNLVEKKTNETVEKSQDRSAEPEMSMENLSTQSNQTLKRLLDQQEETDIANLESRGSSKKSKTMNQEYVEDKPQGMIENSPSSSGNTAVESVIVTENVLDTTLEKSVDPSQVINTKELDSKLMEGDHENKLERETVLLAAIEKDKEEAELDVSIDHNLSKDIASTTTAEENTKTKERTFTSTPKSELKGFSFVEVECWKEIHSSKDDAKGSLKKEVQVENLHGNFSESNTENRSAEEGTNTIKVGCMSVGHCVNLSPEKLLDEYAQLESEEAGDPYVEAIGSSKKMKIVNQECMKDKQKGMVEDSPFTSEIRAAESDTISENDLDSTPKCSVEISPRRNTQELNSELIERECEEKHEQDTILMAAIKDKEEALSPFVSLIERSEVSNPEAKLFVETTPSAASILLEVSNPEAEPDVYTGHIFVKDIDSTVIAREVIKTKKESLISLPRYELKEHSFVTKSAEAVAQCWNEIQSSKDDEECSVEKEIQAENLHASFSERNTENNKGCCIAVGDGVNLDTLDEVKDDNLEKSEHIKSCERRCKLNALELSTGSSSDFTSIGKHFEKCFEEDERKALSQPLPGNKDSSAFADSAIFTTAERNLLLMKQLSEKGKTLGIDSVAHHNDETVESHAVVLTTPKQVFMLGDAGMNEEDVELTAINFPDESDVVNTTERYLKLGSSTQTEARDKDESSLLTSLGVEVLYGDSEQKKAIKTGEKAAAECKDESVVPNFPEIHAFPEDLGLNEATRSEKDKDVELQVDRGIFTTAEKHLLLETDEGMKGENITANTHVVSDVCSASKYQSLMGDSESDEAEKIHRDNINLELLGESNISTILEGHLLAGDYGVDGTKMVKENTAVTYEECFLFTSPERRQFLENSEPHNAGKQEQKEMEFNEYQSHHSSSPNIDSKDDNVALESHVVALDLRENTITDSSGSMSSKVSYNHELNAGQETAGAQSIPKGSQAEDVGGLDATQVTPKKSREHSPHVGSVNHFDFDIAGKETIMEAESNVSLSSYVLALPGAGTSEIVGEIFSYLEVPGTCSLVSEESGPSMDTQNQMIDALEELAITDNIEAKLTKNIQKGYEGNLLSNSTDGSALSGKTCILAETEDEHLDSRNTCEKSGSKFPENEATGLIATTLEKAISSTPDEFTVEDNKKEKAADDDLITREATPSPEETLNESPENENEHLIFNESGKLSEMQVRREPNLIYRTQVKPTKHDMKENAPNFKTLHNLNLTAPRTSKRQPLQDLRKN